MRIIKTRAIDNLPKWLHKVIRIYLAVANDVYIVHYILH